MTITDDLGYLINKKEDLSETEKSYFAYTVLQRFDQVIETVKKNGDLEFFSVVDFIPPSLRYIVADYMNKKIDSEQTQTKISDLKTQANEYLKQMGFDQAFAMDEEKKDIESIQGEIDAMEHLLQIIKSVKN
ncbi:hypothetical protein GQ472_05520 [archaeon]|nr:hypothetical protein [archaeon]